MKSTTRTLTCIAIAWILLVCYTILLSSVAESIIDLSNIVPPNDNLKQIVIFIYGLAIVSFLGGSQIPAVFLKRKSFVIQFGFSAAFGFMLLLINIVNETTLKTLNQAVLKPFFLKYPTVALEYLSIPYFFMVFIDLYLSGRLVAFSWKHFSRFISGPFLHPRRTFDEVSHYQSILFSLVTVVLVSIAWIARTVAFSSSNFVPARWHLVLFNIYEPLDFLTRTTLIIPAALLLWLLTSLLVHSAARQLGGKGGCSKIASLLGFAFLPSLITTGVDLLELGFYPIGNTFEVDAVFLISDFVTLILWPIILAIFAVQESERISPRSASLAVAIVFLPLLIVFSRVFL